MDEEQFNGLVTIRVRFRNNAEYQKFRKYILKTDWSYGVEYPIFESIIMDFHNTDDLHNVTKQIVELLQLGFDVYTSHYELISDDTIFYSDGEEIEVNRN